MQREEFEGSEGKGFSLAAAVGNKIDVNETDLLEYYLGQPEVERVLMRVSPRRGGGSRSSTVQWRRTAFDSRWFGA